MDEQENMEGIYWKGGKKGFLDRVLAAVIYLKKTTPPPASSPPHTQANPPAHGATLRPFVVAG